MMGKYLIESEIKLYLTLGGKKSVGKNITVKILLAFMLMLIILMLFVTKTTVETVLDFSTK